MKRQIQYGNQRGVPWGISECGYNTVDAALNYQYRAFGVPGLGLQRGLAEDLVIAPYASALALDGHASRGVQQSAKARGCRLPRTIRHVRSRRLHARAPAARRDERDRALVHGPPSRHDVAFARASAAGSADASAIRIGSRNSRRRSCCFRSACPRTARCTPTIRSSWTCAQCPTSPESPVRVFDDPRHADSSRATPVQWPLSRDGHQCRRRIQPLEGDCRHALARGRHLRSLGHVLLSPRCAQPADVWSPAFVPAACPPPSFEASFTESRVEFRRRRRGFRDPHRDRRFARRRHRAAANAHHQLRTPGAVDRRRQLRGSGPRLGCLGRAAPGVFQSVRTDRDHPRATSDPVHAPSARARRIRTQPGAPHDRAWRDGRRSVVRNGSCAIHRPRQQRGQPAGASQRRCPCPGRRGRCWIPSSPSGSASPSRRNRP